MEQMPKAAYNSNQNVQNINTINKTIRQYYHLDENSYL